MKILVTGGAGFIGAAFVRFAIERGYDIVVVDKLTYAGDLRRLESTKGYTFYHTDISDKVSLLNIFKNEKPDYVVHWAAETHVDRSIIDATPFMMTNVIGTQVLLDLSKEFGVTKFINIATDEVYGELGNDGYFYEDTPLEPNSPYSVSKTAQDMLGRAYTRTYGLPVITCRPSNNYGPWQYPEKLLPVIVYKALHNQKIPIYGDGMNIREWLYVDDNVEAVLNILENAEVGNIYNIGSGYEMTNIDVVKYVLSLMNKPTELIEFVSDRPGHDFRYSLNTNKIQTELNWKAETNIEIGFVKTIDWYIRNMSWVESKLNDLRSHWATVRKQ
ncbi:MAG TPA: dTDP-glucose 4,6-dehydratase [Candidatus Kapabacteria bacterium]|nr:dTDP-glucose 4,6-dehydratase [Candidatus Kapabacteria bacterium]